MTNAVDKGYNEGRLAFRRYFAKYGPNVKQNDPRMPPNPYVGYYGVLWLNGFESELRRHVVFAPITGGSTGAASWQRATMWRPEWLVPPSPPPTCGPHLRRSHRRAADGSRAAASLS